MNKPPFLGDRLKGHLQRKIKKPLHFHFDADGEMDTEEDNHTQTSQLYNDKPKPSKIQKIQKKQKRDITFDSQPDRNFIIQPKNFAIETKDNQIKNRGNLKESRQLLNDHQRPFQTLKQQEQNHFTLQLFKDILSNPSFHPSRKLETSTKSNFAISSQIANEWILSAESSNKIRSYLMLYMILYRFEEVGFEFVKTIKRVNNRVEKQIQVKKHLGGHMRLYQNDQVQNGNNNLDKQNKQNYTKNQWKMYLSLYVQWLILKNEKKLSNTQYDYSKDLQFWSMAMNKTQNYALELLANKNPQKRESNVFTGLYLLNCEDFLFRSTCQIPKEYKYLIFLKKQQLEYLPQCHWVLGLNLSLKYFYNKDFNIKIRQCLDLNNIQKTYTNEFHHEFSMLSNYFNKNQIQHFQNAELNQMLLEWLLIQSHSNPISQQEKQYQHQYIKNLNIEICHHLILRFLQNKMSLRDTLKIILELLDKQQFLSIKQKNKIYSDLFYNKQRYAFQFYEDYHLTFQQLQLECRQAYFWEFLQQLSQEYNQNYRFRILSERFQKKHDFLIQLKYLLQISLKYRDIELREEIYGIVTSERFISYWDKDVKRKFFVLIEDYLQKIQNFVSSQKNNKDNSNNQHKNQQKYNQEEECEELQAIVIFLKINLALDKLTIGRLKKIIKLCKKALNEKSILEIGKKSINFIRLNTLSELFYNNMNFLLIQQIEESVIFSISSKKVQLIEEQNQQQQKSQELLIDSLTQFAEGYQQFSKQIKLLRFESKMKMKHPKNRQKPVYLV